MSNPTGRNQFSKGGAGGGRTKVKGKLPKLVMSPQASAAYAKSLKPGRRKSAEIPGGLGGRGSQRSIRKAAGD